MINEDIKPNRKVLFVDEHGKNIVYETGDYKIAVDDPENARYITLWCEGERRKVGFLDAWESEMSFKGRNGKYLSIKNINIEPKHRGRGFGKKMYQALIDFSSDDIKGIFSYLPNRNNKKQVPNIYRNMGSKTENDYEFIDFVKERMITKFKIFEDNQAQKFEIPEQIRKYYVIEGDMSNIRSWRTTKFFYKYVLTDDMKEESKYIRYVLISLDSNHIIPINMNDEHKVGYDVLWNVFYDKYKVPEENYVSICTWGNHYIYHIYDKEEKEQQLAAIKKYLEYGGDPKLKIHFYGTEESNRDDYEMTAEQFVQTEGSYKEFQKIMNSGQLSDNGQILIDYLEKLSIHWTNYIKAEREVNDKKMEYIKKQFIQLSSELNTFIWRHDRLYSFLKDISSKFERKMNELNNKQDMNGLGMVLFSHSGLKNYIHIKLKEPRNKETKEFFWNVKKAKIEFDRLSNI